MSDDWKVGDVAQRIVYDGPDPHRARRLRAENPPPEGKVVRVTGIVFAGSPKELGLVVEGYPSNHPTKAWHHLMFRKLNDEPDDVGLVQRIRKCRPARLPETVA